MKSRARGIQQAWHTYTALRQGGGLQQWLLVPLLVGTDEYATTLPAGADEEARLKIYVVEGRQMQHYTNIHRTECLARGHPLVATVSLHKVEKALHGTVFDEIGRAKKERGTDSHQSK